MGFSWKFAEIVLKPCNGRPPLRSSALSPSGYGEDEHIREAKLFSEDIQTEPDLFNHCVDNDLGS